MDKFVIQLIEALETAEGEKEVQDLWDRLDKDGDGRVTGKEWGSKVYAEQEMMSKYFGGTTLSEIGEGFNRIDTSGDDNLTWEEFRAEVASYKAVQQLKAAMADAEAKKELKELWDRLDSDADGKVTGKEWGSKVYAEQEMMSKFFGGTDLPSIGKGFNRIDKNGDDLLTWEEFEANVNDY